MKEFREKVAAVFHREPQNANCAQSVALIANHNELFDELKSAGGGRADDGLCGALYTALKLTPEYSHAALKAEFASGAGALRCKEIKGGAKTPCAECVALGAFLQKKYTK